MSALVVMMLAAEPSVAALEANLRSLETNRVPIELGRQRAWGLRIGAGAGYVMTAASGLWAVIEAVRLNAPAAEPLGGAPYPPPVPPLAMVVVACVFVSIAIALHGSAHALDAQLDSEESMLEEAERPVRRLLHELKDTTP
jgi:hypothetical protein